MLDAVDNERQGFAGDVGNAFNAEQGVAVVLAQEFDREREFHAIDWLVVDDGKGVYAVSVVVGLPRPVMIVIVVMMVGIVAIGVMTTRLATRCDVGEAEPAFGVMLGGDGLESGEAGEQRRIRLTMVDRCYFGGWIKRTHQ